jgi:hypothetical protein
MEKIFEKKKNEKRDGNGEPLSGHLNYKGKMLKTFYYYLYLYCFSSLNFL